MPTAALLAVGLAAVLDRAVREFPARVHPVALFGSAVATVDREWPTPSIAGLAVALGFPLLAAAAAGGFVAAGPRLVESVAATPTTLAGVPAPRLAAALLAAPVLFAATSLRLLLDEATAVASLSESDPGAARDRLPALAGRDPSALSPAQVRSAAVESVAENLADGLVAPLAAFALGATVSLPLAAAAAAWVKAVNTLDSMLGYPGTPHGAASARLDDFVMFLPARLSALLLAVAAADPDAPSRARHWARRPPSPNSGWPMATLAAVTGVRLEKPGSYGLNDAGALPDAEQARHAVRIVGRAGWLAWVGAGVVAWS